MSDLKTEFRARILLECLAYREEATKQGDHETLLLIVDVMACVFDLQANEATQIQISQN